jgi:hypothetical protein
MKFIGDRRDRGLIRGRIWFTNHTSYAHVALAWTDVGRGLLPLLWELGFVSLE